jgi:pimeloyl-ACP methyl ester carboxylesterase
MMKPAAVYIHGKGGSAEEADHYRPFLKEYDVIGFDYTAETPWEAKKEFGSFMDRVCERSGKVLLIANSIGAFYSMHAFSDQQIEKALFISPVIDMEELILNMMSWANVTEDELRGKGTITTDFNETLSWDYLQYVREHPVSWTVPTSILYGEKDGLTSYQTVSAFSGRIHADLTVMNGGEHWFHTPQQMDFLDAWLMNNI